MELLCSFGKVRPWRAGDESGLVRQLNNRKIWLQVRDQLPHPYTKREAERWVVSASEQQGATHLAIEADGRIAGGIGFAFETDVNRFSAEIGYWIGEHFWGRGIATEAVTVVTDYAFQAYGELVRIFALPFADNVGSRRVLEKAGYELEGILHDAAVKEGKLRDQAVYARLRRSEPGLWVPFPRWEEE